MDWKNYNSLPKNVQIDIAMFALVKYLTGNYKKYSAMMTKAGKNPEQFLSKYEDNINEIVQNPADVLTALKSMVI